MGWGMEDPARRARTTLSDQLGGAGEDWAATGRTGPPEALVVLLVLVLAAGAIWFALDTRRDAQVLEPARVEDRPRTQAPRADRPVPTVDSPAERVAP